MKFSAIVQGTRARQRVELPLQGAKLDAASGDWIGATVEVDLRPLLPEELATVQAQATAYAKKKDVPAEAGNTVFDMALAIFTVHAAAMDPDQPDKDVSFFDVAPETLFRAEAVSLDALVYVYERQILWQMESSPRPGFITADELEGELERMGGDGDKLTFFFAALQPGARLMCLRTMAAQLVALRRLSSGGGSFTALHTTNAARERPSVRTKATRTKAPSKVRR